MRNTPPSSSTSGTISVSLGMVCVISWAAAAWVHQAVQRLTRGSSRKLNLPFPSLNTHHLLSYFQPFLPTTALLISQAAQLLMGYISSLDISASCSTLPAFACSSSCPLPLACSCCTSHVELLCAVFCTRNVRRYASARTVAKTNACTPSLAWNSDENKTSLHEPIE